MTELQSSVEEMLPSGRITNLISISKLYAICGLYSEFEDLNSYDSELLGSGPKPSDVIDFSDLQYLTPNRNSSVLDDEELDWNTVVLYVDISGEEAKLRSDVPIEKYKLSKDDRHLLAYSSPDTRTGNGDFSLTQQKNDMPIEVLMGSREGYYGRPNMCDRFTHWPNDGNESLDDADEEFVEFVDEIDERGIIESIRSFGNQDRMNEKIGDVIYDEFELESERNDSYKYLSENGLLTSHSFFFTVKFKTEEDGEYLWPSQIPEIVDMSCFFRKRKILEGAGGAKDSVGKGVDYLSNEKVSVTGGSGSVLDMYPSKKSTVFQGLNSDNAWRSHPFASDTSLYISLGNDEFSRFRFNFNLNTEDNSISGCYIYYLPYPIECAEFDDFIQFYEDVFSDEARERNVQSLVNRFIKLDTYQLYSFINWKNSNSNSYIMANEIRNIDNNGLFEFALSLANLTQNSADNSAERFLKKGGDLIDRVSEKLDIYSYLQRSSEKSLRDALLNDTPRISQGKDSESGFSSTEIYSGGLFGKHILNPSIGRSSSQRDVQMKTGTSVPLIQYHQQILEGKKLNSDDLICSFVNAVESQQRKGFESSSNVIFMQYMFEQYGLLYALYNSGLLSDGFFSPEILNTVNDEYNSMEVDSKEVENRDEKLAAFIDDHSVLDNPSLCGVFCLGGLVGRLSNYQSSDLGSKSVSHTIDQQYPIDAITSQNVHRIAGEVINKNITYQNRDGYPKMNSRYTKKLADTLLQDENIDESTDKIRWVYALGLTYGYNDDSISNSENNGE